MIRNHSGLYEPEICSWARHACVELATERLGVLKRFDAQSTRALLFGQDDTKGDAAWPAISTSLYEAVRSSTARGTPHATGTSPSRTAASSRSERWRRGARRRSTPGAAS